MTLAGGLWEEDVPTGDTRSNYRFNGRAVAMRAVAGGTSTVTYLHGDPLGSVSTTSNSAGALNGGQLYDPFGRVRVSINMVTKLAFTGQRQDDTGLVYYGARYYDPTLGRFASADSVVPGSASGQGGAAATLGQDGSVALRPLAVDFHEPGFASGLVLENAFTQAKGFHFQLGQQDRQQAKVGWGPLNPQALNRYSYVLNNPLRYTDPTGHDQQLVTFVIASSEQAFEVLHQLVNFLNENGGHFTVTGTLGVSPIGVEGQASGALWALGYEMYGFIQSLIGYLQGYLNGYISGTIYLSFGMTETYSCGPFNLNWCQTYSGSYNRCDDSGCTEQETHYWSASSLGWGEEG